VSWTLNNFHNHTGSAVSNFTIVDMPGRGLNFQSAILPAFTHGAGVTYDIRYTLAGSSVWHTYASGIDASRPFSFNLPQPGDLFYTNIGFFFGNVPANFGLGNTIVVSFVVSADAPGNVLTNDFIVRSSLTEREGGGEVILERPGGGNAPQRAMELGIIPQTGLMDHALWLASVALLAVSATLGTLSYMKAKKRKRGGTP